VISSVPDDSKLFRAFFVKDKVIYNPTVFIKKNGILGFPLPKGAKGGGGQVLQARLRPSTGKDNPPHMADIKDPGGCPTGDMLSERALRIVKRQ
jgi:hypothetical protein